MADIEKNIEDFVIIDGEKILKDNAIKTEPVSEETLAGWQQSFEDYQRELKKQRQQERDRHKREFIESFIVPGDVEASIRKLAEAIYNLDMRKQDQTIVLGGY